VAEEADPMSRDVTAELLRDSSQGPGEYVARVARAKPAKALTPTLTDTLARVLARVDNTMGFTSKALAYSSAMRHSKSEHTNIIRLLKGGHLRVVEIGAPPPHGTTAHRDSPYGDRYYVLEART
jgi:hypothetical protein